MKYFLLWSLFAMLASPVAVAAPVVPNYVVPIHGHGKYVNTPQGRIYYEQEGHGTPIILVAGGPGGSHASFHPWFSRLATDHTVIYFDNLGRGRSDRLRDPKQYTVTRDAEDIEALRRALGFDKISVLGHSYGGMPALAYALKYPTHVSHLILSDTLRTAEDWQANIDTCNFEARTCYPDVWAKLLAMRQHGIKTGSDAYEGPYGEITEDLYWYNPENAARLFHSGDPADGFNEEVYQAMLGTDPEWKVGGTMQGYMPPRMALAVPTLICVGRNDRIASPRIARQMARALPAALTQVVVFEKSGHRPWIEETDRYFSVVSDFLADKPVNKGVQ